VDDAGINDAIEALYAAFAAYPRFDGYLDCTHCVPEAQQDALRPVALRALTPELLRPVVYNAGVGTFGEVDDYRHFLPRLLELLLRDEDPALEAGILLAGLRLYKAEAWPAAEQRAVADALAAWVRAAAPAAPDAAAWEMEELQARVRRVAEVTPLPEAWPARLVGWEPVPAVLTLEVLLTEGRRLLPCESRAALITRVRDALPAFGVDDWRALAVADALGG
jgi:hypothetical protein